MKYLLASPKNIAKILNSSCLSIFLDYDGTIVPIASTPQKAVLPGKTKELLDKLSEKVNLTIISGRSLKDIKNMAGIKNITYAGNHGLEIEGSGFKNRSINTDKHKNIINKIKLDLKKRLPCCKGAIIEDKGLTLAVHYRLASQIDVRNIKKTFYKVVSPWLVKKKIRITSGKKALEVRPYPKWNKGGAVLLILKNKKGLPVCIGDDITDEDAFKVLRKKGVTIFVGNPRKSYAEYYLKNTKEVIKLLRMIVNGRNNKYN